MRPGHDEDEENGNALLKQRLLEYQKEKQEDHADDNSTSIYPSSFHYHRFCMGVAVGLSLLATTVTAQATIDVLLRLLATTATWPTILLAAVALAAVEMYVLHLQLWYWYGSTQADHHEAGAVAGVALNWLLLRQTNCRIVTETLSFCVPLALALILMHQYGRFLVDDDDDDVVLDTNTVVVATESAHRSTKKRRIEGCAETTSQLVPVLVV